jgi:hypothetical protein
MISHIRHVWVVLGILMITGWLYWPGLSQSFVSWDDEGHITENQQVRHFGFNNVRNIFRSDVNRTYIPLTILTFSIEHYFWGFNPSVFHFDNLILHLAVVILIYILALR